MGRALDSFMRGFGRSFSPGITEGANLGRAMLAKREQQKRSSRLLGEKIAREEEKEERRRYEWREGRTDRTTAASLKAGAKKQRNVQTDSFNPDIPSAAFRAVHGVKPGSQMAIASEAAQAAAKVKADTKHHRARSNIRLGIDRRAGHRETAATTAQGYAKELLEIKKGMSRKGIDRKGRAEVEAGRRTMAVVLKAATKALARTKTRPAAMRLLSAANEIVKIQTIGTSSASIPRSLLNTVDENGKVAFGTKLGSGRVSNWIGFGGIPAHMIDETR
jgi:hypothetical protein